MARSLYNDLRKITSYLLPTMGGMNAQIEQKGDATKNLSKYISPVQIQRIRQDVRGWREWIEEAENAWYPQRVKMQRGYLDTKLNAQVISCMERRMNMTLLKKFQIVDKVSRKKDEKATQIFMKKWFRKFMKYQLEAKAFGYSLIYLNDCIEDDFPKLSIIRRFNISPDRFNVTRYVYSISGAPFLEEPYKDWHIWVDTPSDVGVSECGYGYLYPVALYEIFARNLLGQNADATEMYGMPIRVGKTNKQAESEERAIFEQALAEMGSAGWMLMDAVGDSVELMESKSLGQGYKIYESLEKRLEQKISKIILGHADAMDSVPGKIGGAQGGEESPVADALRDTSTLDMTDLVDCVNNQLIPKLRNIGFLIADNLEFEFENNEEISEARKKEDDANLGTATVFKTIKDAGGEPDWTYFTKRTGITTTKVEPPPMLMPGVAGPDEGDKGKKPMNTKVKARLEAIYARHKH